MVELKPHINQITPNWTELTWPIKMVGKYLAHRIACENWLLSAFEKEIVEIRAGYQSSSIIWSSTPDLPFLKETLARFEVNSTEVECRIWRIPVCYESEYGKDLHALAKAKRILPEELIHLHSRQNYQLIFYGFLPGFMYLSGLDPQLSQPRKSIPDRVIQAGSVAIGGDQTGIYPMESPGGWHVIGRTPIPFFDPKNNPPVWAKPGDEIRFYAISSSEFEYLETVPTPLAPL